MVNTIDEFGIYITDEMPAMDPTEAKVDGNSQDWPDEDGLDVYDADEVYLKEFEVEIPMLCYGNTPDSCRRAFRRLVNYMTGKSYTPVNGSAKTSAGTMMMVYQPWVGYGRRQVRYKSASNHQFWRDAAGYSVYTFAIKVEVCDPTSVVKLNTQESGLQLDN